eukprot:COSAG06_NODE_699_length_12972_cov_41.323390_6_plen_1445_part_00
MVHQQAKGSDTVRIQLDSGDTINYSTNSAATIVQAMTDAATALAKQIALEDTEQNAKVIQREKERLQADGDDDGDASALIGKMLHVVSATGLREAVEITSSRRGMVNEGSIVEVLEVEELAPHGLLRVRCSSGWLSTASSKAGRFVELAEDQSEPERFATKALARSRSSDEGPEESAGSPPGSPAAPAAPAKKSMRRRMSVSVGLSPKNDEPLKKLTVNGQTQYEVKQGSKRLELQVGSLALQLFKGGKPTDNILYKDMAGWSNEDDQEVQVSMQDPETKGGELHAYHRFQTPMAAEIVAAIEEKAAALAEAAKAGALQKRSALESAIMAAAEADGDEKVRVKILKRATVRETAALDSPEAGRLQVGTVVSVLEVTRVRLNEEEDSDDADDDEEKPSIVRVRFKYGELAGWTSVAAKSGNQMLEQTDEPLSDPKKAKASKPKTKSSASDSKKKDTPRAKAADGEGDSSEPAEQEAKDTDEDDEQEADDDNAKGNDDTLSLTPVPSPAAPAKKSMRRRMSVSVGLSPKNDEPLKKLTVNGQTQYEVKQGRNNRLELQVGSMSLQVFKDGKPIENILYKSLVTWDVNDSTLTIELDSGKELTYDCGEYAQEIADGITETAKALAGQMLKQKQEAAERELAESQALEARQSEIEEELLESDEGECRVVVLKKATVRETQELDSEEVGLLDVGTVVSVLEAARVVLDDDDDSDDDDEDKPSIVRVRFEYGELSGWTSVRAKSGNRILDLTEDAVTDPSAKSPGKPKKAKTEEDDDAAGGLPGQTMYEVKQGSKKLELQVGSMALQMFKGGKPVDNYLYKDMAGWQAQEDTVYVEIADGKELSYTTASAKDADNIIAQMTTNAKALAAAAAAEPAPAVAPKAVSKEGSDDDDEEDTLSLTPVPSPAAPAKKSMRRRMSVSVGLATAERVVPAGMREDEMFECKQGRSSLQLAVGSMALQVFKMDGKPVENILYKDMANWQGEDGTVEIEVASSAKLIKYTTPRAEDVVAQMTKRATELAKQMREQQLGGAAAPAEEAKAAPTGDGSRRPRRPSIEAFTPDERSSDEDEEDTAGAEEPPPPPQDDEAHTKLVVNAETLLGSDDEAEAEPEADDEADDDSDDSHFDSDSEPEDDTMRDSSDDDSDEEDEDDPTTKDSKLVSAQSGRCKALKGAIVRTGSELDSPECGRLTKDTVFEVLEAVQLEKTVRVRFEHGDVAGWTSTLAKSGNRVLEVTENDVTPPDEKKKEKKAEAEAEAGGETNEFGQTMYDVRRGKTKLQLQVGGMALQVFKEGKPIENILYKDMAGWQEMDEGKTFMVEKIGVKKKELFVSEDNAAEAIAAAVTAEARKLAKAMREGGAAPLDTSAPSPAKKGKRRMSITQAFSSSPGGGSGSGVPIGAAEEDTYNVKQGRSKMQLVVGSQSLQIFKGGTPYETLMFQNMKGWVDQGMRALT